VAVPIPKLYWLPDLPDWSVALKSACTDDQTSSWENFVALANTQVDFIRTQRLDSTVRRHFPEAPLRSLSASAIRLAVLGSSTIDHLLPGLRVGMLRRGLWTTTYKCDYGQYRQELLNSSSGLHHFNPNVVLFALDAQHLSGGGNSGMDSTAAEAAVEAVCENLLACWRVAREQFSAQVIQQCVLPVFPALFGNNEHRLPVSRRRLVERINARLRELSDAGGVDLLAIDARVADDGLDGWYDPVLWHQAKQEIHPAASPVYGDLVARIIAAQQGRSAKCIVLDLDNTLWGGVIGDDGLDGLILGQGSALGEAYVAFQHYLRDQMRRGVLLAVCSKNDESNALAPFEAHPEMVLTRGDISCFVANWNDKASNIKQIAKRLNIGLEALVFVDDNPLERRIVRGELPMVRVPELPNDPTFYARCLADAGYVEALSLTAEDLVRTKLYQADFKREEAKSSTTDITGYLRSLKMELRSKSFDRTGLNRIVQLINKTNQYNLVTRRYSESEAILAMEDPLVLTLQLRLVDEFGDNGIIGIVIGRVSGSEMKIDTWLMSCRVLGRQVEQATMNLVAERSRRFGASRVVGEYRPTAKNAMVRDHYSSLGFSFLSKQSDGSTHWALDLDSFVPFETFITITKD
jgi:FkbH-like protein